MYSFFIYIIDLVFFFLRIYFKIFLRLLSILESYLFFYIK